MYIGQTSCSGGENVKQLVRKIYGSGNNWSFFGIGFNFYIQIQRIEQQLFIAMSRAIQVAFWEGTELDNFVDSCIEEKSNFYKLLIYEDYSFECFILFYLILIHDQK